MMSGTNTFSSMIKVTGGAPPPPPPPPPPPSDIFPDPDLDRADTANWSSNDVAFTGTAGSILIVPPIGPAAISLDPFEADGIALLAAISNGIDYTVILTITNFLSGGPLQISLGGGSDVEFAIAGNGTVPHTVTAGDGFFGAFKIAGDVSAPTCTIDAISVIVV